MPRSVLVYAPGKSWRMWRDACLQFCLNKRLHVVAVAHTKADLLRMREGVDLIVVARLAHLSDLDGPPIVVAYPELNE